ncbi:hypothetical protein F4780DRAFT_550817 [Xylariomycetidae sp. FL0641]|nr:hypothetical protein F4780DRAFT_550817 [Xylariomycetidae sp. FL0641]
MRRAQGPGPRAQGRSGQPLASSADVDRTQPHFPSWPSPSSRRVCQSPRNTYDTYLLVEAVSLGRRHSSLGVIGWAQRAGRLASRPSRQPQDEFRARRTTLNSGDRELGTEWGRLSGGLSHWPDWTRAAPSPKPQAPAPPAQHRSRRSATVGGVRCAVFDRSSPGRPGRLGHCPWLNSPSGNRAASHLHALPYRFARGSLSCLFVHLSYLIFVSRPLFALPRGESLHTISTVSQ